MDATLQLMQIIFFYALWSAGIVTIWDKIRHDFPALENALQTKLPWLIRKPLICGLCLSYWVSLFLVLGTAPQVPLSFVSGNAILGLWFMWFVTGFMAWAFFAVVLALHHVIHFLDEKISHHHS